MANGQSIRAAAKTLGLSASSLDRHIRNCAQRAIAKARQKTEHKHGAALAKVAEQVAERETKLSSALLERVERLQQLSDQILVGCLGGERVDADGVVTQVHPSYEVALKAVAQCRRNLELIGRLTGTLEPDQKKKETSLITFESFEMLYKRVRQGGQE